MHTRTLHKRQRLQLLTLHSFTSSVGSLFQTHPSVLLLIVAVTMWTFCAWFPDARTLGTLGNTFLGIIQPALGSFLATVLVKYNAGFIGTLKRKVTPEERYSWHLPWYPACHENIWTTVLGILKLHASFQHFSLQLLNLSLLYGFKMPSKVHLRIAVK